jgi:hypothetical protein
MEKRAIQGFNRLPGRMLLAVLLLLAMIGYGAPRFEVKLDRKVIRLGESAVLTMQFIDGLPEAQLTMPRVNALEIRQAGSSTQETIRNGVRSRTVSQTLLVRPLRIGDFRIPAITARMGGKVINSPLLDLKVVPSNAVLPEDEFAKKEFFARIEVSKTNVFVGESLPVQLKLFFTAGRGFNVPNLDSEGFTFTDLPNGEQQQRLGGRLYRVLVFPKVALPVKAGRLKIGPGKFPFTLAIPRGGLGIFQQYNYQPVVAEAPAVEVTVEPLPAEGRPEGFSGAVGSFKMDVVAAPTNLTAGDPITLQVSFAGRGALENLQLPSFSGWKNFKVYPANDNINYTDQANRVGIRMFEQVVVPEEADIPILPRFEFSFFDPAKRAYVTLKQAGIPLSVAPAAKVSSAPVIMLTQTNQAAQGPKMATELVHIKPSLGTVQSAGGAGNMAWGVPGATLLLWFGLLFRRRAIERLENDPRLRRKLETDRLIDEELVKLDELAEAGSGADFFKLLVRLLQERLGERLDLPASAITENVIGERLRPAGVSGDLLAGIERLFEACNQAHYAPDMAKAELKQLAEETETAMSGLREVVA